MQRFYIILIGVIFLVVLVIILMIMGIIPGLKSFLPPEVTLELWGAFDDPLKMDIVLSEFNKEYPRIKITYKRIHEEEFEEDLIDALASGRGPDIAMVKNTWVPRHGDKLQPLEPSLFGDDTKEAEKQIMTVGEFKTSFVDVAADDFIQNDMIYVVPLFVDTLALYYNKDIFNTAGIARPPRTWEEFSDMVQKLTIRNEDGTIKQAGAAIGTAKNINRSTDIVSLLMMQYGAAMNDPITGDATFNHGSAGKEALEFYAMFSNPDSSSYTWNADMPYSIDAFYEGNVGMMFNYSYHVSTIKAKAPFLRFEVAPMLQKADTRFALNYANYWGLGVFRSSEHPKEAWQFLLWLSRGKGLETYLGQSGRPAPRRDLIEAQKAANYQLGVFTEQALTAKSWKQYDEKKNEAILAGMIDSVTGRREVIVRDPESPTEALRKAVEQINVLHR